MLDLRTVNKARGLKSWHAAFSHWAWQNRGTMHVLPPEAFEEVPGGASRPGCLAGLPAQVTECITHFLTGPTFQDALLTFVAQEQFADFAGDLYFSYSYPSGSSVPDEGDYDYGYGPQGDVIYGFTGGGPSVQVLDTVRISVRHVDTANSVQQVEALVEAEDFSKRWQDALPGSFMNL